MDTMIIAIYCLCDDHLHHLNHRNVVRSVPDAKAVTTALVSAYYFADHHEQARKFLKESGYIPLMLSKSRLNRRLHQLHPRYQASQRRYFYGLKVHVLVNEQDMPVEYLLTEGSMNAVKALKGIRFDLPQGSKVVADKAYTDYGFEEQLAEVGIVFSPLRKPNSKQPIPAYTTYWLQLKRKVVETTGSLLERLLPKSIHSVTAAGFELKLINCLLTVSIAFLLI